METNYEIWVTRSKKHKLRDVSQHRFLADGLSKSEAVSRCKNSQLGIRVDPTFYYYRKSNEPSYAINVEAPAGILEKFAVSSVFEVLYNEDTATDTLKKYEEKHRKHSTGCVISIIRIDEMQDRRSARSVYSQRDYGYYCDMRVRADGVEEGADGVEGADGEYDHNAPPVFRMFPRARQPSGHANLSNTLETEHNVEIEAGDEPPPLEYDDEDDEDDDEDGICNCPYCTHDVENVAVPNNHEFANNAGGFGNGEFGNGEFGNGEFGNGEFGNGEFGNGRTIAEMIYTRFGRRFQQNMINPFVTEYLRQLRNDTAEAFVQEIGNTREEVERLVIDYLVTEINRSMQ